MKNIVRLVVIFVIVLAVVVASFGAGVLFHATLFPSVQAESTTETPAEFDVFWEAWSFLNEEFYGEIPPDQDRVHGAIRGMVASFDDQNTAFIDPTRAAIMSENLGGSFEGIGATVNMDENGRLVISNPLPDHPAEEAGLRPGDIVLEVDGQSLEGFSLYEAVLLIRGPVGSDVTLTVWREGAPEPFDVTVTRARIEIDIVEAELLDSNIGYVQLTQFNNGASEQLSEAITDLLDQGAEAIILDLRSNPGGLLSEAVKVSNLFVGEGAIVIERLKGGEEKVFEAEPQRRILKPDIPLVTLINERSASASEIVAGAIQDNEQGTIIGAQSFGKGSVQIPHTLSDGSELRVTIAEWLTPAGDQIHGQGITPDVAVEMTFEDAEAGLDPQLDEAIQFLSEQQNE